MKNIWLHSAVIIFLAGILLATMKIMVLPALNILSGLFSAPDIALATLSAPAIAFSMLAPALLSGWFTRRHPLLIGAAAGAIAALLADHLSPIEAESYSLAGDASASAMVVAVAALAGRALRYRFRPVDNETSGKT